MTCAGCGCENRAGRKFCAECGAALALACAACGTQNEAGEKFCGECGAALGPTAPHTAGPVDPKGPAQSGPSVRSTADGGARKVVTVVFADLVGSTALHERLDAESVRRLMERYYDALRTVIDAHGGTVVKLLGDGVMAAFGLRRVAEDDAIRAVRAAVAMHEAFRALVRAQPALAGAGLRVGVNTGEVVVSGSEDDVIGDPVNVAARLQEQGSNGDVVVGEGTRRLVATRVTLAPLGSVALKGRTGAVAAYRVESLAPPATAAAAPFVGRTDELGRLHAVYEAAVTTPGARLAVLLGSPGLGKSRLIDEFGQRLGDTATLLAAHCDAAGGATFAPLATTLRALLGVDDAADTDAMRATIEAALAGDDAPDRARIAGGIAALLGGSPAAPEETFFVVRRLLAAFARRKPVLFVIDDLHWAEPLLLDLIEHLVQWGSGVPLFVLVTARPELRDLRSSMVVPGGLVSDVVTLGGLDAGAAMRLAANVIGASDLPAAVAAKVLATSEGNPLFVGELVRMLVQEGALTKEGERWTVGAGLAAIEMPPTIHALLAARIERLRPEERTVLERAAVVGRHFSRSAVAALLGANGGDLDAWLESLRRSELIERDPGWLLGEPALRFHHVLIRDAAYRRLLKGTRAELHERLADWIEGQVGDAPEHDETIGWHLEQAHQHLRELGALDARATAIGARAAHRLAAAGRRALARDDVPLAAGLLGRAIDRLDTTDETRAELALDWCEALLSAGDVGPAGLAIAELARFAEGSQRLRGWHTCFAAQLAVMTAPEELHTAVERVAAAAHDLAAQDDAAGEAKAHFVHAQALARLGKVGACEAALDHALAAARRAGDRRRANAVLAGAPLAALWGPSPVTRASGRCLDVVRVLRITQGAPAVEAVALSCQGVLEALRGRTDAARRMLVSSRTMVEELGITQRLYEVDVFIGRVDLLEGNSLAAERGLRSAYEGFRDLGLGSDAACAAALLGRALLAQGRAPEAESLSHESELLAGDDLQAAIAWRGVRAVALVERGEHAAAIELARAAVAIASSTDALLYDADARLALATVLRVSGRASEADTEEKRAHELWDAKGATLLGARSRETSVPPMPEPASAPPKTSGCRPRRLHSRRACDAQSRYDAAVAARDMAVIETTLADTYESIDHLNGATYGREGSLASLRRILRSDDPRSESEVLATLGDSLALIRRRISTKKTRGGAFDVGEVEREWLGVAECDDDGRTTRHEAFATNRLTEAIERLYLRYAELQPAAVQAIAIARTLQSSAWTAAPARARDSATVVFDVDIVAARPDAILVEREHKGAEPANGERVFLELLVADCDGTVGREVFRREQEIAAVARFDALAAASALPRVTRRVHPNAATAADERGAAAIEAGDPVTIAALFSEAFEEIHHLTESTYGRDAALASIARLMRSRDVSYRTEPLATLGQSLALGRRRIRASGTRGQQFDVGEYENEALSLHEVDAHGRYLRHEVFATDRLGEAIVRLYERYAEGLPEGPGRTRAAAIARSVATWLGPLDPDRLATAVSPSFTEFVDHRSLGTWSARAPDEWLAHWRWQADLAANFAHRVDDVLALEPDRYLIRQTYFGVNRTSGGTFENVVIATWAFGPDGLFVGGEGFEPDREAEALARFDALTADADPFANAATRYNDRFVEAWATRDWEMIAAIHDRTGLVDDRRSLMRLQGGRELNLAALRAYFEMPNIRLIVAPIATRCECLALSRVRFAGTVDEEGGDFTIDLLSVDEVDKDGRSIAIVAFDADDLEDAYAELDRRYDAGEGAPFGGSITRFTQGFARRDWEALTALCAPDVVQYDHRPLTGTGPMRGGDAYVNTNLRSWIDLAPDTILRVEHVRTKGRRALTQFLFEGSRDGGRYELPMAAVAEFDELGRLSRIDVYAPDQLPSARARFDEPTPGVRPRRFRQRRIRSNAATRTSTAIEAAFARRDLDAVAALLAYPLETIEHPTATTYGRAGQLESSSRLMRLPDLNFRIEPLATLGNSLCLVRRHVTASGARGRFDVGAFEIESIVLNEVDEAGRLRFSEVFASDHLFEATVRLYERYADTLPEGRERTRAAGIARSLSVFEGPVEADRLVSAFAPSYVNLDHRSLGTWSSEGPEGTLQHFRTQAELAAGFARRVDDILAFAPDGMLARETWFGTNRVTGGPFENVMLMVTVFGADGRFTRAEEFEPDQEAAALARFDALTGGTDQQRSVTRHIRGNVATEIAARLAAVLAARDGDALLDLHADDVEVVHHATGIILDRPQAAAWWRLAFTEDRDLAFQLEPLATLGDSLAMFRQRWSGSGSGTGPLALGAYELETFTVLETNAAARARRIDVFDSPDHLGDAIVQLYERHAELLPEGPARVRAAAIARVRALYYRSITDLDRFAAALAPAVVTVDHRTVGAGTLHGADALVAALRAQGDLADDVTGRHNDVLALTEHASLVHGTQRGRDKRSGGVWERPILSLLVHDDDGLISRWEIFEPEQEAEALARYDALVGSTAAATTQVQRLAR